MTFDERLKTIRAGMAARGLDLIVAVHDGDLAGYERLTSEAAALAQQSGVDEIIGLVGFFQAQTAEWTANYRRATALCAEAPLRSGSASTAISANI